MIYANKKETREEVIEETKKKPVKITREDIERAMLKFKGEIKYLTIEEDSFYKSNPVNFNSYSSFMFKHKIL